MIRVLSLQFHHTMRYFVRVNVYLMNLSLVIPGADSLRFVNSQLVCLLPVGILNIRFIVKLTLEIMFSFLSFEMMLINLQ